MTKDLTLIANAGSSTYKFDLFRGDKKIVSALYQQDGRTYSLVFNGRRFPILRRHFLTSLKCFLSHPEVKILTGDMSISSVGFRYVHGGNLFRKPTVVTRETLRRLKQLDNLAPLHNPSARRLVLQATKLLPTAKLSLVFDTGFHATLPEVNWRYALPVGLADKFGLRRYGFHGIACASVVRQLRLTRRLPRRLVICHLGSGCSVTAVLDGRSVATSMGMTPLEGLVMGTRAGDLDPGMLVHLLRTGQTKVKKLDCVLEHESGLLGLTGTNDMREILRRKDRRAKFAVDLFCKRVAEYVMRYLVDLGGLDLVVFSGGIGANSSTVRQKVMRYLRPLGQVKSTSMKADEAMEILAEIN